MFGGNVLLYLLYLILFPLCLMLLSEGEDTERTENFRPIIFLNGVSREIENILTLFFIIVTALIPRIFAVIS